MAVLDNILYSESHEWIKVDGNIAFIGISDFAQGELGDIVHVELAEADEKLIAGEPLGNLEAVKTVEDLISPVTGVVLEVNSELFDSPELINQSPYEDGWLVKIELENKDELESLLTAEEYRKLIGE
ncbi:MAG: glycine cleavage system protein GcvH [Candidatus Cloacimonadales bacterium]|jgi:glycine cleavage system H protein|nr:glycine cleavage system protein GcvH [Candidatus Cloacimonadota bacterium]MDD2650097.1 glycine cleavage system protein GcvH [Candidatus Cloacimonadota bacterium]MDD3501958.1 glycine cleavage system protein GcvH [Candidatus Cloacimonadota bacterium]MDX9977974.1 glycine cleavage system protein GcvH [Candidatus Cloacimonadales bacterium]